VDGPVWDREVRSAKDLSADLSDFVQPVGLRTSDFELRGPGHPAAARNATPRKPFATHREQARRPLAYGRGHEFNFAYVRPGIVAVLWTVQGPRAQAWHQRLHRPLVSRHARQPGGYLGNIQHAVRPSRQPAGPSGRHHRAQLRQTDTNAFLTAVGNIYNLNAAEQFCVVGRFTLLSAQTPSCCKTRTLGSELDYIHRLLWSTRTSPDSVRPPALAWSYNRGNQPGLGATVSYLFQWDLTGRAVRPVSTLIPGGGAEHEFRFADARYPQPVRVDIDGSLSG
jgi:hypothetical protein